MIEKLKHTNLSQKCKLSKSEAYSCFWVKSPEQNPVRLSAVHTKLSWKTVFAAAKIITSVKSLQQVGNFWFFYSFKPISILKFAMIKWLLCETCFTHIVNNNRRAATAWFSTRYPTRKKANGQALQKCGWDRQQFLKIYFKHHNKLF